MGKHIGRSQSVGIGKETTRGTVVTPAFWLPLMDFDFDDKFEYEVEEEAMGVIEDSNDLEVVKKLAIGKLGGQIRDKSFGLILLNTYGGVASAVKETTAYDHTFNVAQSVEHQSLTLEVKNDNEQLAFANCMTQSIEISAEIGKNVNYNMDVRAKLGVAASNTPSIVNENKLRAKDIIIKFADDLAGLDAASPIKAKKFNIIINKNLEDDDILGSDESDDYNNKQFSIEGTMELNYDATTYKALALAGTQKAVRFDAINTDVTIGASSNPELKTDIAKIKFTEFSKNGGLNDIIKQTLSFKGLYSFSDAKAIQTILTNEVVSY